MTARLQAPAELLVEAVRSCLVAELGPGAAGWADQRDREPRELAMTGLGTTAGRALGSDLLAGALAGQHLSLTAATPHTVVADALADAGWHLALVLSPFKPQVGAALDGLSPSAVATGIVDTLVRHDGRVLGLNTNTWALEAALQALLPGVGAPRVLLLGSGGTAASALLALTRHWPDAEIFLSARRRESAAGLLERFSVSYVDPASTPELDSTLVINSTTWGETPESEAVPFAYPAAELLRPATVLFDLNNRRGALQDQALATGCVVMSGTLMQRVTHACRAAAIRYVLDGGDQ